MPLSSRTKLVVWCIQFAVLLAGLSYLWLFKSFTIVADLNQIFNVEQEPEIQLVSEQLEQQQLRQHLLLVGHQDKTTAINYALRAAESLNAIAGIAVKVKFDALPQLDSIVRDYLNYPHAFISEQYRYLLQANDSQSLFNYQFSLLNEMASPWVAATLEKDKTLALADFFNQQSLPSAKLKNHDGFLIATKNEPVGQTRYYVLVNFMSNGTGLDLNVAKKIAANVTSLKKQALTQDTGVDYLATGAAFFTASASSSAQNEMTVFGAISVFATLLLIMIIYRSALSVFCTLFVVSVSMIYGYTALRLLFTEVNVLTLVFAVTLIGIAADYSFHALSELRFSKPKVANPLHTIRSSLLLSFLTTTAGYLILVFTPLILFKQIAVFTMAGLLGTLLCVLLLYPSLVVLKAKSAMQVPNFISGLHNLQQVWLNNKLAMRWQLLFIIVGLFGLTFLDNDDDPRHFYKVPDDLITQQQTISDLLAAQWDSSYLLIAGENEQQVLRQMEQLLPRLEQLQANKEITAYSSISQWLPSISMQKSNQQLLSDAVNRGDFTQLNSVLGFNLAARPLDEYQQLDFATWQNTKVAPLFTNQWLQIQHRYYSVIKLKSLQNTSTVKSLANTYTDVFFIDKVAGISEQIGQFRLQLIFIYALALTMAMAIFWLRYGLLNAFVAVTRPLIAVLVALILSTWFYGSLTVFNYVAGILILALGLDYCIFYAEHGLCKKITLTTCVSALSSLFVFAILIVSSTPAVSQFGFTVFIGVVVVFLISPRLALVSKRNI
ncbi:MULTISPECIES: MMPL family transporter [unclassified Pseudoalteromonas]|uniref:MMPL family transporter n=1 Tax=unclassified Pseudoalteromonas TaxID=194690 RepID=UPI0025B5D826|nr:MULTISPECIES: MMPL family transporter [unclassified Pseudoalteromonas]MDN3377548.1 MMPL family transporter [Pseudoalteromonas sp. APC 3893]MDN3385285.1 MMPL family transporter [Pseudoalteromonas sp. APC 4017]